MKKRNKKLATGGEVKTKINELLAEKQKTKEFKDTEYQSYTKKYKVVYNLVNVQNLSEIELDSVVAFKMVVKDKVWEPINIEALKEQGYSSGAVFLISEARRLLAKKPFDSKDARNVYVTGIDNLQKALADTKTYEEVKQVLKDMVDPSKTFYGDITELLEKGKARYSYVDMDYLTKGLVNKKLQGIYGKSFINLCNHSASQIKLRKGATKSVYEVVQDEIKDASNRIHTLAQLYEAYSEEDQQKRVDRLIEIQEKNLAVYKEDLAKFDALSYDEFYAKYKYDFPSYISKLTLKTDEGKKVFRDLIRGRWTRHIKFAENKIQEPVESISENHKVREENWGWTEKKSKRKKTEGAEPTMKINTKVPLDYIKRTDGLQIPDVTAENIQNYFGFGHVSFGNYVKDDESKEHVRHFLGAMADLGDILDIDIKGINQFGGLDISFGAMGVAGHMATYFPSYKAINLTKKKGDGSIGHEWGHYLDNVLVEKSVRVGDYRLATRNIELIDSYSVREAMKNLMGYIKKGDGTAKIEASFSAENAKGHYTFYADNVEDEIINGQKRGGAFKYAPTGKGSELPKYVVEYYSSMAKHFNKEYVTVPFYLNSSKYYYNSSRVAKSAYWVDSAELFARAFEGYLQKKLADKNRVSNYLVAYEKTWETWGERMPYPQGKELEKITGLFDLLILNIKSGYDISGFQYPITERQDEYLELEKDVKKEKVETGIIVDKETKEVKEVIEDGKEVVKTDDTQTQLATALKLKATAIKIRMKAKSKSL